MALKPIILKGEQKKVLFLQVTEPIQIKGVAGSGKTTVALYRAKHLLDTQSNLFQEAKVAIFTYSKTLVKYINAITPHISGGYQPNSEEINPKHPKGINVRIFNFDSWAFRFLNLAFDSEIGQLRQQILPIVIANYQPRHSNILKKNFEFFNEEISWIKGKLFNNKQEYIDAIRTGRGTTDRVTKADKEVLWEIYIKYNQELRNRGKVEYDDFARLVLEKIEKDENFIPPFSHIIIDEAQDLSKAQILVLSKLVSEETKSISIIADAAQRIYKSGFTWSEVGLNVRGGRTIAFKKNYRNTKQIAFAAKSLLDNETDNEDFTEIEPVREGNQKPIVGYFSNWDEQCKYILKELKKLEQDGNINSTVILHRNHNGIRNIKGILEDDYKVQELLKISDIDFESDSIKICTLSSVKGLEFENVFIIDLNDNIIPYPAGFIDTDDEFHISTERRLLYTSMTRARERLYLLSSGNPTRYLSEIDESLLEKVGGKSSPKVVLDDDLPF
ncbi:UvrD-helicase domain-containing protein [Elizabethkingia anophelis]|uniref:3'-5' exonuclease n=1 Tax=Elizabethkingia anophelis TaxID=1117645 RepID=UPI000995A273|nr:3'-5' exonuclease [Elizabethkingia anophelis]AQW99526.1 DNA helicase UvrD [Elizabethkingia anophelis]AQX90066.1 DNA helicase UvrD [Elizabethkingia anophelis]ASV79384.1 ATP-dependent helicase [Elizabethkingia anophelis]MCL1649604.1 UvrD-helicase domain-containing protein [Elizabethkingia anophelis]MCL1684248.1 UvrD-helicase domain-containing protein [Elizabethkingia anophelis]